MPRQPEEGTKVGTDTSYPRRPFPLVVSLLLGKDLGTAVQRTRWEGHPSNSDCPILDTESRPAPAPIKFTPHSAAPYRHTSGPVSFQSPLASLVLPYFIPHDITVLSVYGSSSSRLPMGTIGFSRVLRRNFSLKVSVLL